MTTDEWNEHKKHLSNFISKDNGPGVADLSNLNGTDYQLYYSDYHKQVFIFNSKIKLFIEIEKIIEDELVPDNVKDFLIFNLDIFR